MTAEPRIYASLTEALAAYQVPVENHAIVKRICAHLGIERFVEGPANYFKAVRPDGDLDLHIAYGFTNGFASEEEARAAAGEGAALSPSSRGKGRWYAEHPTNQIGDQGGGAAKKQRDFGQCSVCQMALPASGECDNCA